MGCGVWGVGCGGLAVASGHHLISPYRNTKTGATETQVPRFSGGLETELGALPCGVSIHGAKFAPGFLDSSVVS